MKIGGSLNNINNNTNSLSSINEKLASGKRINSAKDDAAGLQIAMRLLSQNNEYLKGVQNANDGISVTQVADAALGNITDSMERIRELSLQSGSGILTADDRQALQAEVDELVTGINDTINDTTFGGVQLLNQSGSLDIQTGESATTAIQLPDAGTQLAGAGFGAINITSAAGANSALNVLDQSSQLINDSRAEFGAVQNRLESNVRNLQQTYENTEAARSRIADADYAALASQQATASVLQQASIAMATQGNAQQSQVLNYLGK